MKTPVSVLLSYPQGGGSKHAELTIRDQQSGMLLAKIRMTANELMDFMSTTHTTPAAPAKVSDRLDRVGKHRHHDQIMIGHVSGHYGSSVPASVQEKADAMLGEGWDAAAPQRHRDGWAIHLSRWDDTPAV